MQNVCVNKINDKVHKKLWIFYTVFKISKPHSGFFVDFTAASNSETRCSVVKGIYRTRVRHAGQNKTLKHK